MATVRKATLLSSSCFTNEWAYDVFLSFRGEDTREGFTGHLYNDLRKKGINTFIDDQELRKGDEITPTLVMAIQQSRIAIVIFSINYASSSFCLEELTEIMECIKHKGRLVWPVFYQVDPSDVRHHRGSYAEALAEHERKNIDKKKVKRWRLALQEAANLSGFHFEHGYEYEFIGKITQEVSKRINRKPLHVAKYPVGLESRVQEVNSLLEVESDDGVHMVGIHGMGGLGKTTLACAVYNSIADRFDGLCFLGEVRENSMKHGLVQLQEMLLLELAGLQDVKLWNVNKGIPIIKSRLCQKKILLILDDVDRSEQLEALAGELDWFGSGSRIIITTRDKHLLQVHGVEKTYEVQVLNHEEAIELFSWNAFKTQEVNPNYMDISKTAVLHSDGLPLSLEIIGSDLCGRTTLEWKSALETYERIPHENILEILKVSYDGLKEIEKEIFLDIACFFKGDNRSDVMAILHSGRGFAPDYAIGVLIDKSLIKLDGNRVMMHDMIEDMGREIVRLESPLKPGERSRLWFPKDILHVFKENKGSDKTEIIILHLPKRKTVQWDGNALKQMENLKILVIKNASFSRGPNNLPNSLRVLKWSGYPESSLPAQFDPKKLVTLDLYDSFITFENQPIMKFKSLTEMDLSCCKSLKQVPDMSGAQNLKRLNLDDCWNLVEVHDSVGFLGKLEYLSLCRCTSLRVLPRGIKLPSLNSLSLVGCGGLKSFPEILDKMEKLTELCLIRSGISELPFSIGRLVGLEVLTMTRCDEVLVLPISIFTLPRLGTLKVDDCKGIARINKGEGISQELETMSSNVATHVVFSHCHLLDEVVATLFPFMHHVSTLNLNSNQITVLPSCINACRSMKKLTLNNCKELREIRGLPPNIKYFEAKNCTSLSSRSMILLGQVLLGQTLLNPTSIVKHVCFPDSTIQWWLNPLYRTDPSLSFWFRNKFPAISLCVVGYLDPLDKNGGPFQHGQVVFDFDVIINGCQWLQVVPFQLSKQLELYDSLATKHIILLDLELKYYFDKIEKLHFENEWNLAEISLVKRMGWHHVNMDWTGVYVREQNTNMEDIQIINPAVPVVQEENKENVTHGDEQPPKKVKRLGKEKCLIDTLMGVYTQREKEIEEREVRDMIDDILGKICQN